MRVVWSTIILAVLATPALADKASYCQAYARDFSDQRASDKESWQHKFQIALDACLASHKQTEAKPIVAAAQQAPKVIRPAPPKVAVVQSKPAAIKTKFPDVVQPAAASLKPKPGTQAWNDYCAKKYVSFDPKTGKYKSFTGAPRRCVVTNDAKT